MRRESLWLLVPDTKLPAHNRPVHRHLLVVILEKRPAHNRPVHRHLFVVILEKRPSITSFTVLTTLTSAQEQYLPSLVAKPILEHYCTVT